MAKRKEVQLIRANLENSDWLITMRTKKPVNKVPSSRKLKEAKMPGLTKIRKGGLKGFLVDKGDKARTKKGKEQDEEEEKRRKKLEATTNVESGHRPMVLRDSDSKHRRKKKLKKMIDEMSEIQLIRTEANLIEAAGQQSFGNAGKRALQRQDSQLNAATVGLTSRPQAKDKPEEEEKSKSRGRLTVGMQRKRAKDMADSVMPGRKNA